MSRTFLSQSPITLILLTTSLGMSGCLGRQTGSEIEIGDGDTAGEYGPHCEEAKSTPVAGDEAIEGTTLTEEVLAAAIEGEYESELAWNAAGSNDVVIAPESGDSSISITIEPISGSAEWVEREVVADGESGRGRSTRYRYRSGTTRVRQLPAHGCEGHGDVSQRSI